METDFSNIDELFKIENTIDALIQIFEDQDTNIKRKLKLFINDFNEEFPESNPERRGMALSLVWSLMDAPLILYAMDMNGPAIVELHAIIERFCIRDLAMEISKPEYSEDVTKIMERLSLRDFTKILVENGTFDKEDMKFIELLSRYRNAVAHKNPRLISNLLNSGKELSFIDIDSKVAEIDCKPFILGSLKILIKLIDAYGK